jgi:hypothetical protein
MTVIDVHTHMLNQDWFALLRAHGAPRYEVRKSLDAPEGIFLDGAPFMTPMPGHFDYDERIRRMDAAGVDLAIISLTCPNVYWGGEEISLRAARIVNDDMARAQRTYPSRIRWMASLPWEYPASAVAELRRAHDAGSVGVMVLANIAGRSLTEPHFAPIWQAIDELALPVLVHPTAPPGTPELDIRSYNLIASVGFIFDTSLSIALRALPEPEDHRLARRRRAAVSGRAPRPVLRQHGGLPDQDAGAAGRVHAAHLLRRGDLPAGGPGAVRRGRRRRSRDVWVRLSAQYRRYAGLPRSCEQPAAGAAAGGPRSQRRPYLQALALSHRPVIYEHLFVYRE